jgi:hypothetical protein
MVLWEFNEEGDSFVSFRVRCGEEPRIASEDPARWVEINLLTCSRDMAAQVVAIDRIRGVCMHPWIQMGKS